MCIVKTPSLGRNARSGFRGEALRGGHITGIIRRQLRTAEHNKRSLDQPPRDDVFNSGSSQIAATQKADDPAAATFLACTGQVYNPRSTADDDNPSPRAGVVHRVTSGAGWCPVLGAALKSLGKKEQRRVEKRTFAWTRLESPAEILGSMRGIRQNKDTALTAVREQPNLA